MKAWLKKYGNLFFRANREIIIPTRFKELLLDREITEQFWLSLDYYYLFTNQRIIKIKRSHSNNQLEYCCIQLSELRWCHLIETKWNSKKVAIKWGYHSTELSNEVLYMSKEQPYFGLYEFLTSKLVKPAANTDVLVLPVSPAHGLDYSV